MRYGCGPMRLRDTNPAGLTSVIRGFAFVASKLGVRASRAAEPTTLRFPIAGAPAALGPAVKKGIPI